jgi:succinate dehydrogenase flavin-adding protein (antitoxin of CptAB toxin-antitoxin module)
VIDYWLQILELLCFDSHEGTCHWQAKRRARERDFVIGSFLGERGRELFFGLFDEHVRAAYYG